MIRVVSGKSMERPTPLIFLPILALPVLLLCVLPHAGGETYTVTNLNDSGDGSLRWAIEMANNNQGQDVIRFDDGLSGTIRLESALPTISDPVIIDGSTAGGPITIDGQGRVDTGLTISVWWGETIIKDLSITGFSGYCVAVIHGLDEAILEELDMSRCGFGGVIVIRYGWGATSYKVSIVSSRIHDNYGVGIAVRASGVQIVGSEIYGNGGAGVYVTFDGERKPITGPSILQSYIHRNQQEGIAIVGPVHETEIAGNRIEWNRYGGVTLTSMGTVGPTYSMIEGNWIGYNGFQDIALTGEGTSRNQVSFNYVTSDENTVESLGILVGEGADENSIEDNIITNHRYEGIAVIGPGTTQNVITGNRIGAFNERGEPTWDRGDGNGAGILVGNDAAPEIHYPFPVHGSGREGPKNTAIMGNFILQNRGAGIILIRTTSANLAENTIQGNELCGVYWVGSGGVTVEGNSIVENDGDGVRIEPYYGTSASPTDTGDDVLPWGTLQENSITGNRRYGIRFLDTYPGFISDYEENQISDNGHGAVAGFWLGYGRLVDHQGRPVTGKVIELLKNDGDESPDYVWRTWDGEGRYGPDGFSYHDISTWSHIIAFEYDEEMNLYEYNPYRFRVDGRIRPEIYSWDGLYPDPPEESGGAVESPPRSGVFRYQYVTLREEPRIIGGEVQPAPFESVGENLRRDFVYAMLAFTLVVGVASAAVSLVNKAGKRMG